MKQGRVGEAKETLRRVKSAVADGPRDLDSHLKAYDRAQQMLWDLNYFIRLKKVVCSMLVKKKVFTHVK